MLRRVLQRDDMIDNLKVGLFRVPALCDVVWAKICILYCLYISMVVCISIYENVLVRTSITVSLFFTNASSSIPIPLPFSFL